MRARAVNVTSIFTALGTLAVLILFGDTASAASARRGHSHSHARARAACDSRAAAQRAFSRIIHRGPERKVLRGVSVRLQRGRPETRLADGDEAIQNDGAAIGIAPDPARTRLEPLAIVASSHTPLPLAERFAQTSPRGPPPSG